MKRKRVIKGLCDFNWIQTGYTNKGIVSMECEHPDGFYLTTELIFVSEECLGVCELCKNKKIQ